MGRRGRPPVEDPRTIRQFVRLNKEENKLLDDVSKDLGMSRADAIRTLIENHIKKGK